MQNWFCPAGSPSRARHLDRIGSAPITFPIKRLPNTYLYGQSSWCPPLKSGSSLQAKRLFIHASDWFYIWGRWVFCHVIQITPSNLVPGVSTEFVGSLDLLAVFLEVLLFDKCSPSVHGFRDWATRASTFLRAGIGNKAGVMMLLMCCLWFSCNCFLYLLCLGQFGSMLIIRNTSPISVLSSLEDSLDSFSSSTAPSRASVSLPPYCTQHSCFYTLRMNILKLGSNSLVRTETEKQWCWNIRLWLPKMQISDRITVDYAASGEIFGHNRSNS